MPYKGKFFGLLATISILFFASPTSAFELPGIPNSGAPSFWNNVKIDMNDNGSNNGEGRLKITGRGNFAFNDGTTNWAGQKVIFRLQAFYNDAGDFLSGDMQIKGGIAGLGIDKGETLMTANLIDWNLSTGANPLWGFATDKIVCNPLLLVTCTVQESVYVQIQHSSFDGIYDNGKYRASGYAITTVPVPAAAWLFGSALVLLGWIRRPRGSSTVT